MEPTVIFEDADIIVLDKPSGMIVLPDGRHDYPALTGWLAARYGEDGFHLVHRIDRETSGVLVVATQQKAHALLKEQFQSRSIRKIYRAFVYGILKEERGVIDKPIGNSRGGRGPRSALRPHGTVREALTTYKVLDGRSEATYLEVMPKTGRTHQIRVHLASIQHPVLCDRLYAPSRPPLLGFERLALHAFSLSLTLPSGEAQTFIAPLPQDFIDAEGKLRS